jgi:cob(I)alamin adenosyltransferase
MSEKGDKGLTLGQCNMKMSKDSPFVRTVGVIDDFQARLGLAKSILIEKTEKEEIDLMQVDLHQIMGSLYEASEWGGGEERVTYIEEKVNSYRGRIKNLGEFLIPGNNELDARLNFCRTGCRLVEEEAVSLRDDYIKRKLFFDPNIIKYFNKLSTYLYFMWRDKIN